MIAVVGCGSDNCATSCVGAAPECLGDRDIEGGDNGPRDGGLSLVGRFFSRVDGFSVTGGSRRKAQWTMLARVG